MNRRRLILSAAGVGLAATGLAGPAGALVTPAPTPTDDDLAYANFGLAAEFLLQDFYGQVERAKLVTGTTVREIKRGGFNAAEHAFALEQLLKGAAQTAAVRDDFDFTWPDGTFATKKQALATGLTLVETLLGVYLRAAAVVTVQSYRGLYASMAANLGQQAAALSEQSGGRIVGISFAPALELKTASDVLEAYLG